MAGSLRPDRPRGEVPDNQALFRAALHRTTRASFDARGSPVTYAVLTVMTACTEDTQYRFGVLHFAYLLVLLVSDHLCPFALLSAFPSSLTGRCSWTTTGTVSL